MTQTFTTRPGILRKKDEEFVTHWLQKHGVPCKKLPGLRRHSFNLVDSARLPKLPVTDGRVPVPQGPGLGAEPDTAALDGYRTWTGRA